MGRVTFRFFKGSAPSPAPEASPHAAPGAEPAPSGPPAPAPAGPGSRGGGTGQDAVPVPPPSPDPEPSPEAETAPPTASPYLEALREALAADSPEAWERVNAESSRLEAEERRRFRARARAAPSPPAPESRTPPPPPARRIRYESRLARESREAYARAPLELREALDALFSIPGVHRVERSAWSGTVGAWTRDGAPSAAGNAFLAGHGEIARWVLGLGARCYEPREASPVYFAPEELEALGVPVPPEGAGLPLAGAPDSLMETDAVGEEGRNGEGKGL